MATAPVATRRSLMTRLFTDSSGELRGYLILALVAGALVLMGTLSTVALLFGSSTGANALGTWVLAIFLLIKLPLLGLIWWVLGRRRERGQVGGWSERECDEILEYLEREARTSMGRPDAASRLEYFSREAWFVAQSAADQDTERAVATAHRIDALAQEVGVDTTLTRAGAMSAGSRG